ncbi:MAG: protoporphyrinogen/coproporphyrinogen oxidase [Thermoanaerobaculia bacterium]
MSDDRTYAVVGGGVSGIAAAHYLQKAGLQVELLERGSQLGGRVGSCKLGDRWLDFGGKNIGRNYHLFREFTSALGDNPYEYFGINSSQVRDGRIVTFDSSRRWSTLLGLLRQCSPADLVRFARLCLRVKRHENNGYLGSPYFNALAERLDQRPAGEYFGAEFCRRLLRPMTVRMNGAEPDEVFMGNMGSNIRMILDSYDQLELGMSRVIDQFAATVKVRPGARVESLVMRNGRLSGLRIASANGGNEEREYAGVVLALRAPEAAPVLETHAAELAELLREVRYFPVALVLARYRREIFSPEVRALVFGDDEVLSNAGVYGIDDLDVVRYTFSGRAARALLADESDPEAWLGRGEEALNRYVPVNESERLGFVSQHWRRGLCAYTPYYPRFEARMRSSLAGLPGVFLTGDYIRGASIEACFRAAKECASKVMKAEAGAGGEGAGRG